MNTSEREREKAYMDKHPGEPNPWQEISNAMKVNREIYAEWTYVERMRGFSSDLEVRCPDSGARGRGEIETQWRPAARVSRFRPALAGTGTV